MSANDYPLQTSGLKTGSIPIFSKVKALGIDIPATLLARTNEAIEERSAALDGSVVGPSRRLAQRHIQKFGATRKSPSEGSPTQSARSVLHANGAPSPTFAPTIYYLRNEP